MTPLTTTASPPEPWAMQRSTQLSTTDSSGPGPNSVPVDALDPELVAKVLSRIESASSATWIPADDLLREAPETAH